MTYRAITIKIIVAFLFSIVAMNSQAGIVGSAHDFSDDGWAGGQICVACHAPHKSNTAITDAPLWNRQDSSATYNLYYSPTLQVAPTDPRGPTKLCLSCHDGTVALDSFGGKTGETMIPGTRNLGTDLSNDHPVSIEWQHQTVESSGDFCFNCHFGEPRELRFFRPGGSGPIWIECSTCHDVHNNVPNTRLLRSTLTNSKLCLTCHEK